MKGRILETYALLWRITASVLVCISIVTVGIRVVNEPNVRISVNHQKMSNSRAVSVSVNFGPVVSDSEETQNCILVGLKNLSGFDIELIPIDPRSIYRINYD